MALSNVDGKHSTLEDLIRTKRQRKGKFSLSLLERRHSSMHSPLPTSGSEDYWELHHQTPPPHFLPLFLLGLPIQNELLHQFLWFSSLQIVDCGTTEPP